MTKGAGRATRGLSTEIVTDMHRLSTARSEWNALAEQCSAQPFGLPGLALPWWSHLGRGDLNVVLVRNGSGELIGLAPFRLRRKSGLKTISFLGHGLGAVGELLLAPSKGDVAAAIWSSLDGSAVLHLTDYRHQGGGLAALRRADHWSFHANIRDECPIIELREFSSVKEFLARPAKGGLRKKLARADRSVAGQQRAIAVFTTPDEVRREWEMLQPLYDSAEAANPRLHLGQNPYQQFFTAALCELAAAGQLTLLTMRLGGRRAAFDVYIRSGSTAYAVLGRFDPELAAASPGQLLTQHGIQWAIDSGVTSIDLQLGGDQYKMRWADRTYDTLDVVATGPNRQTITRALLASTEVAYDTLNRLRSSRPG